MYRIRKIIFTLGFIFASYAGAQQHPAVERGFAADKIFQFTNLDDINLFSGNVAIEIPLGLSYPIGGNLQFRLKAIANSKSWDYEEDLDSNSDLIVEALPGRHQNAGLGWYVSLGLLLDPDDLSNESDRWVYQDSNGGRHSFFSTLHPGDAANAGVWYTRDSTYLRMTNGTNGRKEIELPNGTTHTFLSNGQLEMIMDTYNNWLAIDYTDTASEKNWALTDSEGRSHEVVFERLVLDDQANPPSETWVVSEVRLAAFNSTTATYQFAYTVATIRPGFGESGLPLNRMVNVALLDSITKPTGTSFDFTYSTTTGNGNFSVGAVDSLTLPTGGRIDYVYGLWRLPTGGCDLGDFATFAQINYGVSSRSFYDGASNLLGTWDYNQDLQGPPPAVLCTGNGEQAPPEISITTVTTPLLDKELHFFSVWPGESITQGLDLSPNGFSVEEYGLPIDRSQPDATGDRFLSTEIQDCDENGANCVTERQTYFSYEFERPCTHTVQGNRFACEDANKRVSSQRILYLDDPLNGVALYADTNFSDFDGLGHYRQASTDGNFPKGNERTSVTSYNSDHTLELDANFRIVGTYNMWPSSLPWVLNTFTEQSVTENGQTAISHFCFNSTTGFLERQRTLLGATPQEHDMVAAFTEDGSGNLTTESYYGGDAQTLGTDDLCDMTLNSPEYQRQHTHHFGSLATTTYLDTDGDLLTFSSVDMTIDPNTGLASVSRDTAGLATTFEYDSLGRLTLERPQTNHGARTRYSYTAAVKSDGGMVPWAPARALIERLQNNGQTTGTLAQEEVVFDALGRVSKNRRFMPDHDWVVKDIQYDPMGHQSRVSEWFVANAPASERHWTDFEAYDPFDRPGLIRAPDDNEVTLTYDGDRVVRRDTSIAMLDTGAVPDEQRIEVKERFDRQGRLDDVTELPQGATGEKVLATYAYDVGNRLRRVTICEGTGPCTLLQTRDFTYDHLGNLISESHPEKNGLVEYPQHDSRGHVLQKIDGDHDLSFTYDSAERLTEIRRTGSTGSGGVWKTFSYATNNGVAGNRRKGKLWSTTRHNRLALNPVPPGPEIFADDFENGDLTAWSSVTGAAPGVGVRAPGEPQTFDAAVTETYFYKGVGGRISQRNTVISVDGADGESFTQSWDYTELGEVATIHYPQCTFARCTEDGADAPRSVDFTHLRGYLTAVPGYATSITYHPNNMVDTIQHSNGVLVTQANDLDGMQRPRSISAAVGGVNQWSTGIYQYDGTGNIKAMGSGYFVYDGVHRLVKAAVPLGPLGNGEIRTQGYVYDATGNIQEIVGNTVDPGRMTPTDTSTNQLTGGVYDDAGNLTSWNGASYEYDPFNMMTRFTSGVEDWLYTYNVFDERIWQNKNSAPPLTSRYSLRDLSGKVLRQILRIGENWSIEKDYIYRDESLLAAEFLNDQNHFHLDHLNTPRLITSASGQHVARHDYYPYGEEISGSELDDERMKFTGHERDLSENATTADNLDYMIARFHLPLTGRFMSTDPANESTDPRKTQSWNRYSYVQNSPLNFIDPSGRILIFFGTTTETQAIEDLVNEKLFGQDLTIDQNTGIAELVANDEQGPPNPSQTAFATIIGAAIGSPENIEINLVTGDPNVVIDQFFTGKVDIQDLSMFPSNGPASASARLAAAIAELTVTETLGISRRDIGNHRTAHSFANLSINSVARSRRTKQDTSGFSNTVMSGVIAATFEDRNRTTTVEIRVIRGNVTKVTVRSQ